MVVVFDKTLIWCRLGVVFDPRDLPKRPRPSCCTQCGRRASCTFAQRLYVHIFPLGSGQSNPNTEHSDATQLRIARQPALDNAQQQSDSHGRPLSMKGTELSVCKQLCFCHWAHRDSCCVCQGTETPLVNKICDLSDTVSI